jgi:hypothetical protein
MVEQRKVMTSQDLSRRFVEKHTSTEFTMVIKTL